MTDEEHEAQIETIMEAIQPELISIVERFAEPDRETALMAVACFGIYFLGRFSGAEVARDFAQLMVERADEITGFEKPKKYDA